MVPGALIPAWFCLPIAAMLFAAVAVHMGATHRSEHPPSRKRIRNANGILILINLPLLATGFSLINPNAHPQIWALVWLAAGALLFCNVTLAMLDVVNTLRLARHSASELPLPPGALDPKGRQSLTSTGEDSTLDAG